MPWTTCPVCAELTVQYEIHDEPFGPELDVSNLECQCSVSPLVNDDKYFDAITESLMTPFGLIPTGGEDE
jgi:hypothetical protein